ncbi:hypothetical protein [Leisingera sp. ANG-S5]|uniref:hypothetical protein n=1 Tax=Leisingera sp. ANG-S5 TaxID=1577901 RepID=UPI00057EDB81|nr:hypothetical protein [Leisingera sp. ANG-S5]KIC32135.1 hypothetical protein RA25_13835 [Leisingera sp. ANG-S5]
MDNVSGLVAVALGHSRTVGKCLDAKIIPLLAPRHRKIAGDISRRIGARTIINETFLSDLEALIVLLGQEAEKETTFAWRGHEHDPDCGYQVSVRTERASALLVVLDEVVDLATAVEHALDAAEAEAIANALFET